MESNIICNDKAMACITMNPAIRNAISLGGYFTLTVYDKDGNFKGETRSHNIVTTQGLNWLLNVALHNSTGAYTISTWYCALASTNTAAASTMTYAVPSYTEVNANYSEATRPEYADVTASTAGTSISNSSSKAVFTVATASTSFYGAALVNSSVKGDTATGGGILFSYALLSTARDVVVGDTLNLTYQVAAS